jgi:hypothetical protein
MTKNANELVLLRNTVHGTQYVTRLRPGKNVITESQRKQWEAALCGRDGCQCSDFAGIRGSGTLAAVTVWTTGERCEYGPCPNPDGSVTWTIWVPEG